MTKPTGKPRGRPKEKEYVTLMARVPLELAERAKRYAGRKQQTISVVIRDALEVLIEDDRFSPFVSDRNGDAAIVSDRKGDAARSAAHTDDILSDMKRDEPAPALETPVPDIVSDTKGDGSAPDSQEPAIVSDTKEGYDTSKYELGELCVHGHDYHGTGQSLNRLSTGRCAECAKARDQAYRDRKRQRAPVPG